MDTVTLSGGPSTGKEGDRGGARAGLDGAAQRTPPPTPVVVVASYPSNTHLDLERLTRDISDNASRVHFGGSDSQTR